MKKTLEFKIEEAWKKGLVTWNNPSIPYVIIPQTPAEYAQLGEVGEALKQELAFMKFPEFQMYGNLGNIAKAFPTDPQRGLNAVVTHEMGHRFCPYDLATSILLQHAAKKSLEGKSLPYAREQAAQTLVNLFADEIVNTKAIQRGNSDIPWAYSELSEDKQKGKSKLWKVYARSMEQAWKQTLLPPEVMLTEQEAEAAQQLAELFKGNFFDKEQWRENMQAYARILHPFLEEEREDKQAALDNITSNIPAALDEKTQQELARRLAEIGSNGLPTNLRGLKEFQEIMAGFGQGDAKEASILFYDRLSDAYDVTFAQKPFGRPRTSPFQPEKWHPSMGAAALDVAYSQQIGGGRMIPGVTTYAWKHRRREIHGGVEEVTPDIDLYLDTSASMPDPIETISLPALAAFVVAKKAHRRGAKITATNFSGKDQYTTTGPTKDLQKIFRTLVIHYNGGTVLPVEQLEKGNDPRQVLLITDADVQNRGETADAIKKVRERHKHNRVAAYALHANVDLSYLRQAGAEVMAENTPQIFKRVIGKADEVYRR